MPFRGLISSGVLLAALTGCLSAPANTNTDNLPAPGVNSESYPSTTNTAAVSQNAWWDYFDDAVLDEYMQQVFANNFDLAAARSQVESTRAAAVQARALLFPEVTGTADIGKEYSDARTRKMTTTIGAMVSWEPDVFGRLSATARAEALDSEAAAADRDALQLLLSGSLAQAYYGVQSEQAIIALLSQQAEADQRLLRLNELRLREGIGTEVEVLQQREQLTATESQLPRRRALLKNYENQLAVLVGQTPQTEKLATKENGLPKTLALPATGLPIQLLERRPDLRAAKLRLAAADARTAAAVADQLPRLSLTGMIAAAAGTGVQGPIISAAAGLLAPLLDWGRRAAAVSANEELFNARFNDYTSAYLKAIAEADSLIYAIDQQEQYIKLLDKRIALLTETRNKAEAVYKQGLSDYLPVLTALKDLKQAERDAIAERLALIDLHIRLNLAVGGSVDTPVAATTPAQG